MAVRLVANDKLPFAANEEGGWVAMLAWWKQQATPRTHPGVQEKAWNVYRDKGRYFVSHTRPSTLMLDTTGTSRRACGGGFGSF